VAISGTYLALRQIRRCAGLGEDKFSLREWQLESQIRSIRSGFGKNIKETEGQEVN
jgi:hypothetical protein